VGKEPGNGLISVVRVVHLASGKLCREWKVSSVFRYEVLHAHCRPQLLTFSKDGRMLALACAQTIVCWDLKSGRQIHSFDEGAHGVAFAAAGDRLVSSQWEGVFRLWDLGKDKEMLRIPPHGRLGAYPYYEPAHRLVAAFFPDSGHLAVGHKGRI